MGAKMSVKSKVIHVSFTMSRTSDMGEEQSDKKWNVTELGTRGLSRVTVETGAKSSS